MKKLIYPLVALFMFFSCTKENMNDPDLNGSLLKSAKLKAPCTENVFTVYPSGGNDTEALLQAFADAQAAGPGSVVQLVEGTYKILSIEIHQFFGSFMGAGKGKTILTTYGTLDCAASSNNNMLAHLMKFVGGDVYLSDMTFTAPDGLICSDVYYYPDGTSYGQDLTTFLTLSDYTDIYRPEIRFIKAVVNNVEFIGGSDDGSGSGGFLNIMCAMWVTGDWWSPLEGRDYPLSRGEVSIANCNFDNVLVSCEFSSFGEEGRGVFSNNKCSNELIGLYYAYNFGGHFFIENNQFRKIGWAGAYLDDNDWGTLPYVPIIQGNYYQVSANLFDNEPGTIGLYLADTRIATNPDNAFPQLFRVSNNLFKQKDGSTGIVSWNNQGALLKANKFTGEGSVGIMIDGDIPAKNNLLLGNNFSTASYSDAAILLGANSMNCTVIGSGNATITDLGTGNTITGMKMRPGGHHMGPGIHHNFRNFNRPRGH